VPEVQQHADVVHAHRLDPERRLRGRVPEHPHPRLARLVLDDDLDVRVGLREPFIVPEY
jgi:hypothetical protein